MGVGAEIKGTSTDQAEAAGLTSGQQAEGEEDDEHAPPALSRWDKEYEEDELANGQACTLGCCQIWNSGYLWPCIDRSTKPHFHDVCNHEGLGVDSRVPLHPHFGLHGLLV